MSRGLILGIETSCDETAAAVVKRGSRTLSSVVASQIATHARYGGVVPELASREHLRAIVPVVRAALAEAGVTLADLDAIAVTSGPGLAGALLVGITYAKALAFANQLPLIAVNHLEGHIHAVLLNERESASPPKNSGVPGLDSETGDSKGPTDGSALALVVSGGHTHLYLAQPANGTWHYTLVGRTVDDAAGEAFDKVAKLLGLGYPGGPWIDSLAKFGNPHAVPFAFAQIKTKVHLGGKPARTKAAKTAPIARLDPHFLFSFSGIKTAVLRYVELHGMRAEAKARAARLFPSPIHEEAGLKGHESFLSEGTGLSLYLETADQSRALAPEGKSFQELSDRSSKPAIPRTHEEALALCPQPTLDLIASFQHAVVGDLMKKTFAAAESLGARRILVTGGVAANRELRERFTAGGAARGLRIAYPTLALSTDNAAMIAAAAWPRFNAHDFAPADLSADPSLTLG
jgi:N6-L-threonylcarbamoyladenine synthase